MCIFMLGITLHTALVYNRSRIGFGENLKVSFSQTQASRQTQMLFALLSQTNKERTKGKKQI